MAKSKYRVKFNEGWTKVARDHVEGKTKAWNKRGAAGQVRSDLATCARQAYYGANYRHLLPASGKTLPDDLVRIFYAGHVVDELVQDTFNALGGELNNVQVHRKQNEPPVQMKHPDSKVDGLSFGVTTDYVFEYDNGKAFVPFEIKSSGKETKGWATMAYLPQNLKQLMYWVYYAKANKLYIPCASLVYIKRSDFRVKQVIASVDEDVSEGFFSSGDNDLHYVDGKEWLKHIDDEFTQFNKDWNTTTLPPKPKIVHSSGANTITSYRMDTAVESQLSIPNYICKNCPYKKECDSNLNTDVITAYNEDV